MVLRARNLKAGANFIPAKSFRARRFYFTNEVALMRTERFLDFASVALMLCVLFLLMDFSVLEEGVKAAELHVQKFV